MSAYFLQLVILHFSMQYNLNSRISFSSPFVSQRKKSEQPVYCATAISNFNSNRQTTCFKAQAGRNLSILWSKFANDSASATSWEVSRAASLSSSTQMQTSASLSHRSVWHLTKDFREACASAGGYRFWSLMALQSKCWMLSAQNGIEVNIDIIQRNWEERGNICWRGRQKPCQMFSSKTCCGCVRSHSPRTSAALEDNRVLGRGQECSATLEAQPRALSQRRR